MKMDFRSHRAREADSPKERFALCYEQAQDELGVDAPSKVLCARADDLLAEWEGMLADEAKGLVWHGFGEDGRRSDGGT